MLEYFTQPPSARPDAALEFLVGVRPVVGDRVERKDGQHVALVEV